MMSKFEIQALVGSLLSALMLAWPAAAQLTKRAPDQAPAPTGSRIAVDPKALEKNLARQMNMDMARCVYDRRPNEVVALLAKSDQVAVDYVGLGYKSSDINKELALDSCLGRTMSARYDWVKLSFSEAVLRGNLAELSYLARHKVALAKLDSWTEVIANRFAAAPETMAVAAMKGDFSDCIVFHDSLAADAILRTEVASTAEADAAKALVPALSKCLEAGAQMELTAETIRRYAASGLWARAHHQGPTSMDPSGLAQSK